MDTTEANDSSSSPAMIDTHCHLDDQAFEADLPEVLEASRRAGVTRWILIGYAPDRWEHVSAMANRIPGMGHTLGVHPSLAAEWSPATEARLRDALVRTGAVAVGEFGLDFYRDNAPFGVQAPAMIGQLRVAKELQLPAVFHMRDAEEEMLDILGAEASLPRMVFHSFDGTAKLTDFILERGAWVGVGGLATRQKSAVLREQLQRIPLDRVILETDAPYLVPARQKDRRNVPAHIRTIAEILSSMYDVPVSELARITTSNAEALFGRLLP